MKAEPNSNPQAPTDRDSAHRRLREIERDLESHRALRVVQHLEEIDRVLQWRERNRHSLLAVMDALNEGVGYLLMAQGEVPFDDESGFREYTIELGLKWHNYVAAAHTVSDHMESLFNSKGDPLRSEFAAKDQQLLAAEGVVSFVRRSRNVLLHRGVFQTSVTYQMRRGSSGSFEVSCRTEALGNRYKRWWTAESKRYLQDAGDRLVLRDVVRDYDRAIEPFDKWVRDRFYEFHYEALAEFEELAAEYRRVQEFLEPGRLPPRDPTARFALPGPRAAIPPKAKHAPKRGGANPTQKKRKHR